MSAVALAQTILTFAAIVAVGAVLRATGRLRAEDARPLNAVIIYVGLPAFIFEAVHGARLGPQLWAVVAVAWLVSLVLFAVAWAVQRMLRLEPRRGGALILASALGNTGYIGYPLTLAMLGAAALPSAVFYDIFGTVFALVLIGLPLAWRFGEHEHGPVNMLREVLTFPAVIALFVALALRTVPVPEVVGDGLGLLAKMVAPLIMLSVGLSLRPRTIAAGASALVAIVVLRLVLAPLVALAAGSAVAVSEDLLAVTVLEAGMPTMMLTLVVAERYGLDTDLVAAAIFVTTVLSALSVPAIQLLVR